MHYVRIALTVWSFRREIGIVVGVLAALIILPMLTVLGFLDNGVQAVSDSLVNVDPVTHEVEIKDVSGNVVEKIKLDTVWPVKGIVTQEFGVPNLPYEAHHTGIDIAAPTGTPIVAAIEGTVTFADKDSTGSLSVGIDHGHNISTYYAHMSEIIAQKDQHVKAGDLIGKVGQTGWATGPHCHFMLKIYGLPVNPRSFMVGDPEVN
jgi:murein DD-endopeptidase MepM/ murein hydrolase activator NlpD